MQEASIKSQILSNFGANFLGMYQFCMETEGLLIFVSFIFQVTLGCTHFTVLTTYGEDVTGDGQMEG